MSPEMLVVLAAAEAKRARKGTSWCKRRGVGRLRELIGRPAENVAGIANGNFVEAQRSAAATLAEHCRLCGKCKLARL